MTKQITTVLKLSDAIRDLKLIDGLAVSTLVRELLAEAANALDQLGRMLCDPDSRRGTELRAQILRGGDKQQLSTDIAALDEQELICFCGELTTWLGKSRRTYFSSFFAVPDPTAQKIPDRADDVLPDAFAEIRSEIDPTLKLAPVASFKVTNLIAAAGEANLYPKHFAYFLPEDEGVKYAPRKRTVVFMNTYLALFRLISMEESRSHITVTNGSVRDADIGRHLLAWFRGHDIGHSIVRGETDFRLFSKVDRWASMVLQEVIADVFGFLLCMSSTWRTNLDLDPANVCQIYGLEMLRYLRRAPADFPDAGAAFVQLQFLIDHGFARYDAYTGKITLDCDEMMSGMTTLARELSTTILSNDIDATKAFASRYCPHLNTSLLQQTCHALTASTHTLDYVQRIYEQQESASA